MTRQPIAFLLSVVFLIFGILVVLAGGALIFYVRPAPPGEWVQNLRGAGFDDLSKIIGSIIAFMGLMVMAWGAIIGLLIRIEANTAERVTSSVH
jgi:hypothetical protein